MTLSGPSDLPASPTHALVCLHGFGDGGRSYLDFAPALRASLPDTIRLALFCPDSPQPLPQGDGRQWFSDNGWTFRDRPGIRAASEALWAYVNGIATTHGLPLSNIALLGFSQGGMVVYYGAPRWPAPVGGLIVASGYSLWDEELKPDCAKPPLLILHGDADDVVPADLSLKAAATFEKLGFDVETHILPGLAHGIDARCLAFVSVFLQSLWATPAA